MPRVHKAYAFDWPAFERDELHGLPGEAMESLLRFEGLLAECAVSGLGLYVTF